MQNRSQRLIWARENMGCSQGQLARFIGIAKQELIDLEEEKVDISDELIKKWSDMSNTSYLWLKEGIENNLSKFIFDFKNLNIEDQLTLLTFMKRLKLHGQEIN